MTRVVRLAGWLAALSYLSMGCAARPSPPLGATPPGPQSPEPSPTAGPNPAQRPAESSSGHTRPLSERERSLIAELMRAAERVRGLQFVRKVPVWVQDRDAIMAYAHGQFDRDELERATALYTALGLLPAGLDLRELLVRLLGEQIIGYYDDKTAQLFVRDEIMQAFERGETQPGVELRGVQASSESHDTAGLEVVAAGHRHRQFGFLANVLTACLKTA